MVTIPTHIKVGPGQESVWDYPRPPRLEKVSDKLQVIFAGELIAETTNAWRVLETSHPPVYYFPPVDVQHQFIQPAQGHSFCEFKGVAQYWTLQVGGERSEKAAWSYADPPAAFQKITNYFAFYASRVASCWVGNEQVQAQPGDFYGGWITSRIVGPFKGGSGTSGW